MNVSSVIVSAMKFVRGVSDSWWAWRDLNSRPIYYELCGLTALASNLAPVRSSSVRVFRLLHAEVSSINSSNTTISRWSILA